MNCMLRWFALVLVTGSFIISPVLAQTAEGEAASATKSVSVTETGSDVVRELGDATHQVGQAVREGGAEVARQGRDLWDKVIVPMLQRFAAALPSVLKAILLLVAFWIIGSILGAIVAKLLAMTGIDDKAAREWGLGGLLGEGEAKPRAVSRIVGGVVKWIIILFGVVAFFQTLNLQMVAGPIENVLNRILNVLPNLLQAFVILFVYWIVATLVRMGITRGLGALKFDSRFGKYLPSRDIKGETVGPSALIGRLFFYVILLFGIPPFLQALGQQSLVAPLQDMLSKALSYLPNIFAALIILVIGNIIATVVREVVANFLAAAGADTGAEKLGLGKLAGDRKLSEIIGVIVYFFIIVSVIVAAVDALGISAIADPVKGTLSRVSDAIPLILLALIIVLIGYTIARMVRGVVEAFLNGLGLDQLPARIGLDFLTRKAGQTSLSNIGGTIVMVVIMLLTAQQALEVLGFAQLAGLLDQVVKYLPRLAVGLIILFATLSLGAYVGKLVAEATAGSSYSGFVSAIAKYAVMFLGFSMTLEQLGVGSDIVRVAVTAVLGGAALALGLAFGLGGKDKAKEIIERQTK